MIGLVRESFEVSSTCHWCERDGEMSREAGEAMRRGHGPLDGAGGARVT